MCQGWLTFSGQSNNSISTAECLHIVIPGLNFHLSRDAQAKIGSLGEREGDPPLSGDLPLWLPPFIDPQGQPYPRLENIKCHWHSNYGRGNVPVKIARV